MVTSIDNNWKVSTCEAFVDILKRNKIATIIGERTAGAMLSANYFEVDEEFSVFIPVADYLNEEGNRLDKVGVKPHVLVESSLALEETLKRIKAKK